MIAMIAYCLIPVVCTSNVTLFKHVLEESDVPFGLRSAPNIFYAIVVALEWCISKEVYMVEWIYHYLASNLTGLGLFRTEQLQSV